MQQTCEDGIGVEFEIGGQENGSLLGVSLGAVSGVEGGDLVL